MSEGDFIGIFPCSRRRIGDDFKQPISVWHKCNFKGNYFFVVAGALACSRLPLSTHGIHAIAFFQGASSHTNWRKTLHAPGFKQLDRVGNFVYDEYDHASAYVCRAKP